MTAKYIRPAKNHEVENFYAEFDRLDGRHPWMEAVPQGYVSYRVRELRQGKVAYFNFMLAKEMGLIASDHPHQMTPELEQKILKTFSLQIINEYDELNKRRIPADSIKTHKYMATRYLQLQHTSRSGKTSGDGRGIWNGALHFRGKTWDVSSRGTGVTCLAPGAVQANKPLKTGTTEFGYGCGQAEIDELLSAAILAESLHLQGLSTERVLAVIDLGRGVGIGVRAAPNLIRPAHLFLYLKQERLSELRQATDYLIDRQMKNRAWHFKFRDHRKYEELGEIVSTKFAEFTAILDIDYIFAWLDWDGDNVLADAGIIDYGSVRQFGLRHDKYRYDDVQRFSTNLNEQRNKARLMVQVFLQMVDYLKTGKKRPMRDFAHHPQLKKFDQTFQEKRADRLLYRMGFPAEQRQNILRNHRDLFAQFNQVYTWFEHAKVSGPEQKVPDGINHPALFNVRNILRVLPQYIAKMSEKIETCAMDEDQFFTLILSGHAKARDARLRDKHRQKIAQFQSLYKKLIQVSAGRKGVGPLLAEISQRSEKLNSDRRITGNALIEIVEELLLQRRRGLPLEQVQKVVDRLVFENQDWPEIKVSRFYENLLKTPHVQVDLFSKILNIVRDNRETI